MKNLFSYTKNKIAQYWRNGAKISLGKHFFIVFYHFKIFYVYKKYPESQVIVYGIEC